MNDWSELRKSFFLYIKCLNENGTVKKLKDEKSKEALKYLLKFYKENKDKPEADVIKSLENWNDELNWQLEEDESKEKYFKLWVDYILNFNSIMPVSSDVNNYGHYTVTTSGKWKIVKKTSKPDYKVSGKYLFFSKYLINLEYLSMDLINKHGFHECKFTSISTNDEFVLCVYWKDDSRKNEMKKLETKYVYFGGWKSNSDTFSGKYSQKFLKSVPEEDRKIYTKEYTKFEYENYDEEKHGSFVGCECCGENKSKGNLVYSKTCSHVLCKGCYGFISSSPDFHFLIR